MKREELFKRLGLKDENYGAFNGQWLETNGALLESVSPVDGKVIGSIKQANASDYEQVMEAAQEALALWKTVPAPQRGLMIRELGDELRKHKDDLGSLVTLEMGKIKAEGDGEVQEMIDIADFAVGLSRQLYGLTMHSERPNHRMYEQWHPLGMVGLITSFNFPVAVWAWNFTIAAVCGDVCVWKPSSKTPLTAIACTNIAQRVLERNGYPGAIASLVIGKGSEIGEKLISDSRIPLISATGSTRMGKRIGEIAGARLGRTILELGGNNAVIVSEHADMKMALQATLFGACGTAGQRCTTTRRLIIQESIYDKFTELLVKAYKQVKIGDPFAPATLVGPLIDGSAVKDMKNAIKRVKEEGGKILFGGEILPSEKNPSGSYVVPCIAEAENSYDIVQEETFAPILYLIKYKTIDEAIEIQNGVPQGLSSSIFSNNMREAEVFLSHSGSDCGIANVNTGTSGAEIGGAFGGEKETGGGRESGSDAWKAYMRRQTNNINWGTEMPLAQGIVFGDFD